MGLSVCCAVCVVCVAGADRCFTGKDEWLCWLDWQRAVRWLMPIGHTVKCSMWFLFYFRQRDKWCKKPRAKEYVSFRGNTYTDNQKGARKWNKHYYGNAPETHTCCWDALCKNIAQWITSLWPQKDSSVFSVKLIWKQLIKCIITVIIIKCSF